MDISQTIRLISVNELWLSCINVAVGGGGGGMIVLQTEILFLLHQVPKLLVFRHQDTLLYTVFRKWTFSVPIKWAVFGKVSLFDADRFGSGLILCRPRLKAPLINQCLWLSIKKYNYGSGIKDYYKLQFYYKKRLENTYNNSCNCNTFCTNSKR